MTNATTLGLQIVPTMPVGEIVEIAQAAEQLGYGYCMVADEGVMHDVHVCLGAMATATERIRLGAVTNGYTRHPAATAAALATLDDLSDGRAFVTLVAGGTMVLHPMGIERTRPVAVMNDTIEILRRLWSGEPVTWEGTEYQLDGARLSSGPHDIPIWVAARGERLLDLTGHKADGVVVMAKADLGDALAVADRAGNELTRMYLDRLAFTPEMIEEAKGLYAYAILDSPPRLLQNLGIDEVTARRMHDAFADGGPAAVAPLVTDEMITAFQIAGTPDQCGQQLRHLIDRHALDGFILNVISPGVAANTELLGRVASIIRGNTHG
jgi:5,10-methylenetetrahydromethanopterin reductase